MSLSCVSMDAQGTVTLALAPLCAHTLQTDGACTSSQSSSKWPEPIRHFLSVDNTCDARESRKELP